MYIINNGPLNDDEEVASDVLPLYLFLGFYLFFADIFSLFYHVFFTHFRFYGAVISPVLAFLLKLTLADCSCKATMVTKPDGSEI